MKIHQIEERKYLRKTIRPKTSSLKRSTKCINFQLDCWGVGRRGEKEVSRGIEHRLILLEPEIEEVEKKEIKKGDISMTLQKLNGSLMNTMNNCVPTN